MTLNQVLLLAAISVGAFMVSIAIVVAILIRLPAGYFTAARGPFLAGAHPVLRITLLVLKNVAGAVIVALGVVMSIPGVPGQGVITILIGLMLMDFPGKFRLERSIIRRPLIHGFVNRLRRRYGRPPLIVP
jgi:hypothetical protein